jgi:hypothetical protein
LSVVGCGSDVELTVNHVPGYSGRNVAVSALGVFKNGRMDTGAWEEWQPVISGAIVNGKCDPAFDARMEKGAPALFTLLDESAKDEGITDEILDRVGPSARGGAILVIESFGRPPPKKGASADAPPESKPAPQQQPRGRGRGRGRMPVDSAEQREPPREKFEVSVGVYSVQAHEVVASVHLQYADTNKDALGAFSAKLRETLAGVTCTGWIWQEAPTGAPARAASP